MLEELFTEQGNFRQDKQKQSELVKKYCSGIEERIRGAQSDYDAKAIADEACKRIENECESGLVRAFLVQYITNLVKEHQKQK